MFEADIVFEADVAFESPCLMQTDLSNPSGSHESVGYQAEGNQTPTSNATLNDV